MDGMTAGSGGYEAGSAFVSIGADLAGLRAAEPEIASFLQRVSSMTASIPLIGGGAGGTGGPSLFTGTIGHASTPAFGAGFSSGFGAGSGTHKIDIDTSSAENNVRRLSGEMRKLKEDLDLLQAAASGFTARGADIPEDLAANIAAVQGQLRGGGSARMGGGGASSPSFGAYQAFQDYQLDLMGQVEATGTPIEESEAGAAPSFRGRRMNYWTRRLVWMATIGEGFRVGGAVGESILNRVIASDEGMGSIGLQGINSAFNFAADPTAMRLSIASSTDQASMQGLQSINNAAFGIPGLFDYYIGSKLLGRTPRMVQFQRDAAASQQQFSLYQTSIAAGLHERVAAFTAVGDEAGAVQEANRQKLAALFNNVSAVGTHIIASGGSLSGPEFQAALGAYNAAAANAPLENALAAHRQSAAIGLNFATAGALGTSGLGLSLLASRTSGNTDAAREFRQEAEYEAAVARGNAEVESASPTMRSGVLARVGAERQRLGLQFAVENSEARAFREADIARMTGQAGAAAFTLARNPLGASLASFDSETRAHFIEAAGQSPEQLAAYSRARFAERNLIVGEDARERFYAGEGYTARTASAQAIQANQPLNAQAIAHVAAATLEVQRADPRLRVQTAAAAAEELRAARFQLLGQRGGETAIDMSFAQAIGNVNLLGLDLTGRRADQLAAAGTLTRGIAGLPGAAGAANQSVSDEVAHELLRQAIGLLGKLAGAGGFKLPSMFN